MISQVEHQRKVAVSALVTAISALHALSETQPPFSQANSKLTEEKDRIRGIAYDLSNMSLHGGVV